MDAAEARNFIRDLLKAFNPLNGTAFAEASDYFRPKKPKGIAINPLFAIADKRSGRFADIADNRLQIIVYDVKIFWREQHAPTVDHILDSLLVRAGTTAACAEPEPWAGQRLGAQILGKVKIRNAKEVFWEIVSVDQHGTPIIQHRKASNKRPVSRSVSDVPAFIDPKAGRAELAPQMNGARSKTLYTTVFTGEEKKLRNN